MIDGAVDHPNRVQTHLNGVIDDKFDAARREPLFSVGTTEGVDTISNPFKSKIYFLRNQPSPSDDYVFVVDAACEVDFVFPASTTVEAEVVLLVFPE